MGLENSKIGQTLPLQSTLIATTYKTKEESVLQSLKTKVLELPKTNKAKGPQNPKSPTEDDLMDGWTYIGGDTNSKPKKASQEVHVQVVEEQKQANDYDLCQLSTTSSALNEATSNENVWERLYMREFVNNTANTNSNPFNFNNNNNNNNNSDNRSRKKTARISNVAWNNQHECGGFKALYGTRYCEQRLITTLLALKDSTTPSSSTPSKLDWLCKPLVSAHNFFVATEIRALMVGLDNAGKTAVSCSTGRDRIVMEQVGQEETVVPTSHTIGYNFEKVTRGDFVFELWDLEFKLENPLAAWKAYCKNVQALIFVVDCSDYKSISIAKLSLQLLMKDKVLGELPLLVYANKRDLPGAMTTLQVITNLGLHKLVNKRGWHVQACSIVDDEFGLYEGLDWIVSIFKNEEIEKLQTKMRKL